MKICHIYQVTSQANKISVPFARTEVPENCLRKLVTNRGQQFRSRAFQRYLKQNDIKLYKTTPYYP